MKKTFGKLPRGNRLERIQQSPNYREGAFQNLSFTPAMREDASFCKMIKDFANKPKTVKPAKALAVQTPDLDAFKAPAIIWFGHSSYLLKLEDFTLLVDPVFSSHASPVKFFGKSFDGTDAFHIKDLGTIDYVLITHDHYDHMDYDTILELRDRVKHFYTSLGVGAHLEYWGVPADRITELDWGERASISSATITATPGRHFSGRGIKRAQTLWSSFVLDIGTHRLFLGGDSGYDTHFKMIGEKYGPFDLAILECGQYGENWPNIHMLPEQTLQAAQDLQAKTLLPVHWGKFVLALHPWKEPIERLFKAAAGTDIPLLTPAIGAVTPLFQVPVENNWWAELE